MKETAKKQIRDTIEQKDYQARNSGDDNKGLTKTRKAQMLAELLVTHDHIRPVYIDEFKFQRVFYQYEDDTGRWKPISKNTIEDIAKEIVGNDYTRHFKQQFFISIGAGNNYLEYDDMGLPKDKILCRDKTVYDLETGETRKVETKDYALNVFNYHPDERTEGKEMHEFIKQTFPNEEDRKTLQEFMGWVIKFPDARFQKCLLMLGESNTGKSTFMKMVRELVDNCLTSTVSLSQLGHPRRFNVHHTQRSILNIEEDMSNANVQDGSAVKTLIQQQPLFIEKKGKEGFTVDPECKFLIASNVAPELEDEDPAFYEKFLTIVAPNKVPKEEQDKKLPKRLTEKRTLNAFFEWCMEGLERLEDQQHFTMDVDSKKTRRKWLQYGSSIGKFVHEMVEYGSEKTIKTTDVFDYYENWCRDNDETAKSRQVFIREIESMPEVRKRRIDNRSTFVGITVNLA